MAELPMIADLVAYPRYRRAEADWLGEIPAHWETRRAKYLLREINSRSETGKEQLLRISQYTGVTQRNRADGLDEPDTRADSLVGYKRVEPDDLVVNIMLAWNGSMGVSKHTGIASPAYCVYRFQGGVHPWYMHNLFRSPAYKARIRALSTGVVESRLRLYSDDLGRIEALLPPPEEQAAIVRFLDWATGRLDRAIRAKRKVIALLNEQKQGIIYRAVTRGLDSFTSFKPSGVPWLGDIPAHWDLVPNRSFLKLKKNVVGDRSKDLTLLSLTLRGVIARDMDNPTGKWPASFDTYQEVAAGDLVFCLFDIDETPRCVGLSPMRGMITGAYTVFSPKNPELAEWAYRFYLAMDFDKRLKPAYTGLRKVIQKSTFLGLKMPLPGPEERNAILLEIQRATDSINTAISRLDREVELLGEHRTRLIADVIAGKLDVREVSARLPEHAAEATLSAGDLDIAEIEDEEVLV